MDWGFRSSTLLVLLEYFFPNFEDSAFLRFGTSFIFLVLLTHSYWPNFLKPFKNHLWHFALILALPSIFTFTLLANNYMGIWLATHVGMMLLLLACVQRSKTYFLMLFAGTTIGSLWYKIAIDGEILEYFPKEYIPLFLFLNLVGMAFSKLTKDNIIESRLLLERERQKSLTMKSLAGTIAHEMRNPLSQINGTLHLLWNKKAPNSPESDVYLNGLKQVIKSSFQLIDITMDAINEKPIKKEKFKIISALDICNQAVSEYAYKDSMYRKKVAVIGGDFKILADPVLIKYILYNLIGNALYYVQSSPKANIDITLKEEQRKIEVRDTGPGIAPENLSKLFDSFYTSGKSGGTGLGLAYCKRTMLALDGDIHCISELGKFTSFILTFPAQSPSLRAVKDSTY
jgi:signal transduction histidine kinase